MANPGDQTRAAMSVRTQPTFADQVIDFYLNGERPEIATPGFSIMDPFAGEPVIKCLTDFSHAMYGDRNERLFVIGINPGRFGGGVTGIPFTDPWALRECCGIETSVTGKRELSSEFVYAFIEQFGGAREFYRHCFLTAVLPFGLLRDGKNVNYYDDRALLTELTPYIVRTLRWQIEFGTRRDVAIVLGGGKNFDCLTRINNEHHFFDRLVPLDHPRFIMQYRRKKVDEYILRYVDTINTAFHK
jgi:Domain of unknown function (DUF4918)